jgi:ribosomal protein S14
MNTKHLVKTELLLRFRNITISRVTIRNAANGLQLWGLPESPIDNVILKDIKLSAKKGSGSYYTRHVRCEDCDIRTGSPLETFKAEITGLP